MAEIRGLKFTTKGGPGSGHHGHAGRPGSIGGSASGRSITALTPPKAGKLVGGQGGTGTRYGYDSDGEDFVKESRTKEDAYWATPYPEDVLNEGIVASGDEVNPYPGISLGRSVEDSRGYEGDEGAIFRVKVFASNPVEFGSDKISGWDGKDIGQFYELAHAQGFDAITGTGEIRVFAPNQILILGHGMRRWRPYNHA